MEQRNFKKGDRVSLSGKYLGVNGTIDWIGQEGSMIKTGDGDYIPLTSNSILREFKNDSPCTRKEAIIKNLKKKQSIKSRLILKRKSSVGRKSN